MIPIRTRAIRSSRFLRRQSEGLLRTASRLLAYSALLLLGVTITASTEGGGVSAPAITSANSTIFLAGLAGTFTVRVTEPRNATLSETGSLPAHVTFTDNHDGTATLCGIPLAGSRGTYPITIAAHDKSGADATQSFTLKVDAAPTTPKYPLMMSANQRYLVDQNNVPFLLIGDSPQALIGDVSDSDAETYLADRQARGFNAMWINLLCNSYTRCKSDGSTFDGIHPFKKPGDLSTPNEVYFKRADDMINLAAKHGMTVFLDPIETGGWLSTLKENGAAKDRDYGAYLGNRYKRFPNIVWLSGNDFQTWTDSSDNAAVLAVAQGIQAGDPGHIQTIELNYLVSGSLDDSSFASLIKLDAAYTYYPTYAEVLREYNRPKFVPVFMVEANYEFENNNNLDTGTPEVLRRQEYWTMLSGATGQLYGSKYSWQFYSGWETHLDTPGATQLGYLKAFLTRRQWYNLVPDRNHALVTNGYGTFAKGPGSIMANDYLTAASTPDRSLAIAYMPTIRTITVNMSKLNRPATARWFDPSNGTYSRIQGSPFANTGTQQFTPSGRNSDGSGDWVLVLETTPPD